jgi:hypothetical protein
MDTTKHIQFLAKLDLALLVAYLFSTFLLESYLPQELQNYLAIELESEFSPIEGLVLLVMLPLLVIHIASLIGFIRTKLWAPRYFVYSSIGLFLCVLFIGPYVDHAVAAVIGDLSTLVMGAILAMLYATDSTFNKSSKRDAENGAPS